MHSLYFVFISGSTLTFILLNFSCIQYWHTNSENFQRTNPSWDSLCLPDSPAFGFGLELSTHSLSDVFLYVSPALHISQVRVKRRIL